MSSLRFSTSDSGCVGGTAELEDFDTDPDLDCSTDCIDLDLDFTLTCNDFFDNDWVDGSTMDSFFFNDSGCSLTTLGFKTIDFFLSSVFVPIDFVWRVLNAHNAFTSDVSKLQNKY